MPEELPSVDLAAHCKMGVMMPNTFLHFVVMEMAVMRVVRVMVFSMVLGVKTCIFGQRIICSKVMLMGRLLCMMCGGSFGVSGAEGATLAALQIVYIAMVGATGALIGIIHSVPPE